MESSPILKEMHELCRLCLADNCVLQEPLHCTKGNSTSTLLEKILFSTSIQIQDGEYLPTKVCEDCSKQVEHFFEFKQKCLAADTLLRKHVRLKFQPKPEAPVPASECSPIVTSSVKDEGNYRTEDALPSGSPQASSFKYESEMLHVVIKEEEDVLDDSTSTSASDNEIVKVTKKKAILYKNGGKLKSETTPSNTSKFSCQLCGKNFCNKFSLTRHKWSHSKKTITCQYCNKIFKNRESQQRHEKMHERGNRYQCHLCDKSYVSSTSHAAHVRKHTGECPYKCSDCNATFYLLSSFERHVVKHRGVKEYECEICMASFWVPDDLRAHVNRMH